MKYTYTRLENALDVFRNFKPYLRERGLPYGNLGCDLSDKRRRYALREVSLRRNDAAAEWAPGQKGRDTCDSDDDYVPDEFKKKKASWGRKQKGSLKRKFSISTESRGTLDYKAHLELEADTVDGGTHANQTLTLRFVSENGRCFLRKLAYERSNDGNRAPPETVSEEESYFRKYGGTLSPARELVVQGELSQVQRASRAHFDDQSMNDIGTDYCRLRSGKVIEHEYPSKKKKLVAKNESINEEDPVINVDEQSDGIPRKSPGICCPQESTQTTANNQANGGCSDYEDRIVLDKSFRARSNGSNSFSSLRTIQTCFSHPIDFCHQYSSWSVCPPKGCHFCNDWRFGILGYGKRTLQVISHRHEPFRYEETGGGHRGDGKDSTRMCVSCALDRLMIVRCHEPKALFTPSAQFSMICNAAIHPYQLQAWLTEMFKKPSADKHPHFPRPPFPSCSICPAPASYQCCRWQERNKLGRACKIPEVQTDKVAMQRDPPELSQLLPRRCDQIDAHGPGMMVSEKCFKDPLIKPVRCPPKGVPRSTADLATPIKGCGLKLCLSCHNLVANFCNGSLIQGRIAEHITINSVGARADWEFLIKGGPIDTVYNTRPSV